ncbi:MAG: hypothetical protein JWQ21_2593 [Herminiimonas sp.]|nr:hypothetical protein [Herminiimonas sp.]
MPILNKTTLLRNAAAIAVATSAFCSYAHAERSRIFQVNEVGPLGETWVNAGLYSYHFQRGKDLNDKNFGIGVEYRYSTVAALAVGRYYNSNRRYSDYAAFLYQPFSIGGVRLGAMAGAFNGYPRGNGEWFLAALPAASIEYKRIGVNVFFVPNYKSVHGSLSFEFKVKVFD